MNEYEAICTICGSHNVIYDNIDEIFGARGITRVWECTCNECEHAFKYWEDYTLVEFGSYDE